MHPASAVVPMPRNAKGIGRTGKKHKRVADHDLSRQPKSQEGISGPLSTPELQDSTNQIDEEAPKSSSDELEEQSESDVDEDAETQDRRGIRDIPPVHLCGVQATREVVDPITSHDNAHILVIIVMSSLASAPLHLPFGLDCAEILILPACASQTEMCNRCGGTARDQCRSRA